MNPDSELVNSAKNGDQDAFNILLSRYQDMVQGLAFHYTRNLSDAEDITQDIFIKVFKHLSQVQKPSQFRAWLTVLTHNTCRSFLRKQRFEYQSMDDPHQHYLNHRLADTRTPATEWARKQLGQAIHHAFNTLTENERLVASLYFSSESTYQDVGTQLKLPVSTIRGRLFKARQKLLQNELLLMAAQHPNQFPYLDFSANKIWSTNQDLIVNDDLFGKRTTS